MDEELQRAQAEHQRDPADRAAARAFEAALARAGRTDELAAHFSTLFTCPLTWAGLASHSDPDIRECGRCSRRVVLLGPGRSPEDAACSLARAAATGSCVAATSDLRARALAAAAAAPGDLLLRERDPCFVVDVPSALPAPRSDMTEREFWAIHGPKWPSDYDD